MRLTLCVVFVLGYTSPVFADTVEASLKKNVDDCRAAITGWRTEASAIAMLAGKPNSGPKGDLLADLGQCRVSEQLSEAIGTGADEARNAGKQILASLVADTTLEANSGKLVDTARIIVAGPTATTPLPSLRALGVHQERFDGPPAITKYIIGSVDNLELAFRAEPSNGSNDLNYYTTDEALFLLPLAIYSDAFDSIRTRSIAVPSLTEVATRAAARDGKWRSYHFGTGDMRVQLPWELLLNDAWLRSRPATVAYLQCLEDRTKPGQTDKTCLPIEAPTTSWTLLHPSVGITPFNSKGKSSGVTGVIEILGWNCWEYDQRTFARRQNWSVSMVGVYAPAEDRKDWSPGLLLRTPYSGINIVWSQPQLRGGGTSNAISLSVDISKVVSSELNENSLLTSLTSIFRGR